MNKGVEGAGEKRSQGRPEELTLERDLKDVEGC